MEGESGCGGGAPPNVKEAGGASVKVDQRGSHWREKRAQGVPPPPVAQFLRTWAKRAAEAEHRLMALLRARPEMGGEGGEGLGFTLPWRRAQSRVVVGNSIRTLYMHLLAHHLDGVVELRFTEGSGWLGMRSDTQLVTDFFGIEQITIKDQATFDAGGPGSEWDAADCAQIRTIEWGKQHLPVGKYKTLCKLWYSVGMGVSADDPLVYRFASSLRQRHLDVMTRGHIKRREREAAAAEELPLGMLASVAVKKGRV